MVDFKNAAFLKLKSVNNDEGVNAVNMMLIEG